MCSDIASASSLEFCELCPEVRSTLADYCGFSKEQRAAWRDDVWEKAATKKGSQKICKRCRTRASTPRLERQRCVQVLKWNASLHLGDNPQLFFDMLDNMELRTKNGTKIWSLWSTAICCLLWTDVQKCTCQ